MTKNVNVQTDTTNKVNEMFLTVSNIDTEKEIVLELESKKFKFMDFKKSMNLFKLTLDADNKNFRFYFRGVEYSNKDLNVIKFWIKDLFAPVLKLETHADEKKLIIKIIEKHILTKKFKFSYLNKDCKSNDELYNFVKNVMLEALDSLDDSYNLELVNEFKKCISK